MLSFVVLLNILTGGVAEAPFNPIYFIEYWECEILIQRCPFKYTLVVVCPYSIQSLKRHVVNIVAAYGDNVNSVEDCYLLSIPAEWSMVSLTCPSFFSS